MEFKKKIDLTIYPNEKIEKAVSDYKEICEIEYNNWKIIIKWESEIESQEIFNELMNYIVNLIND